MENTCKICGCTDYDCRQCIWKTGEPCHWVSNEKDLCSACVNEFTIKTLLDNMEYIDKERGLCNLNGILRDLNIITIREYYIIKEWFNEHLPDIKYFKTPYSGIANYCWRIGDIDARRYWLKSKLEEITYVGNL